MSSFDDYFDDQDLQRDRREELEELDDDAEAERVEQAHWALEVQSQVALMNRRIRY
jgi:hypothetical protein